jgi:hypothetical protein
VLVDAEFPPLSEVVLVGWTKKRPFLDRAAGC